MKPTQGQVRITPIRGHVYFQQARDLVCFSGPCEGQTAHYDPNHAYVMVYRRDRAGYLTNEQHCYMPARCSTADCFRAFVLVFVP